MKISNNKINKNNNANNIKNTILFRVVLQGEAELRCEEEACSVVPQLEQTAIRGLEELP